MSASGWVDAKGRAVSSEVAAHLDEIWSLAIGDRVTVNAGEYVTEGPCLRAATVVAREGLQVCVRMDDQTDVVQAPPTMSPAPEGCHWFRWAEVRALATG